MKDRKENLGKGGSPIARRSLKRSFRMAVLLIIHKYNPQTSKADYDGFYKVIRSYHWGRVSESNWAINTEEPPKAVWQKLKHYTDPHDYLVMLPLEEPSSWTAQDHAALKWLLSPA
jgi:hypothetical protein